MKLNVPFYPMPIRMKNYCGQYVLKSVLKYFTGKDYGVKKLAKLTKKFGNGFTLTLGLAYAALHEGLNAKYIDSSRVLINRKDFSKDNWRLKTYKHVKKIAGTFLKKSRKLGLEEKYGKIKLKYLLEKLNQNKLPILIINYGKIYGIKRKISHFILLTGYDKKRIFFHDVGPRNPTANKKITKSLFNKSFENYGLIISKI